jgi:hypothetical protein
MKQHAAVLGQAAHAAVSICTPAPLSAPRVELLRTTQV